MNRETHPLPPDWAARLALALEPIQPEADRAARLRARIMERVHMASLPDPHLTVRAQERRWHNVSPGVEIKLLRRETDEATYLLRLAAGMRLPAHNHADDEECLVLEGDVWLGNTHAFVGDYHLARRGVPHGEIHTETGCLLFLRGTKPEVAYHA